MALGKEDDNSEGEKDTGNANGVDNSFNVQANDHSLAIGNIDVGGGISGEVIIAGGNIYKGFSSQEVSVLISDIKSTFQPRSFDGRCPYKGLDYFEEEDAELFF